jgi:hypothetical protein
MAEYFVSPQDLVAKKHYFMVSFCDETLLVPEITNVVYLGRDIFNEGDDKHYFQDYESFANQSKSEPYYIEAADNKLMNFFSLRGLIDLLEDCARRAR